MSADAAARATALDAAGSFIVEAPAGSGKTELLTQRYLSLLARVQEPEQVLAITFTRKAAAEMRQRIVETLHAAASDPAAVPAHRRTAVELARAALNRSERRGWSLLEQTRRLSILTIDGLSASLARQLPVATSGVIATEVTDHAERLYRLAAERTTEGLGETGSFGEALRRLLAAAGNSLADLERWLASILPQRDRWLRLFEHGAAPTLPELITDNLERLSSIQLDRIRALCGHELEARVLAVIEQLTLQGADRANPDPPADAAPSGLEDRRARYWRGAATVLLTSAGSWRRRFTRREGVPPEQPELKLELGDIVDALARIDGLREALGRFGAIPRGPIDTDQAKLLAALKPVCQRLLAELRIVFAEAETLDHTELALSALTALGAIDAPSELLLALDRRIEHILVDEFQDTSHLQWALLEKLTAGWETGDGRTLFIVGDPMQSIYRFRDADLSLFHQAARSGIGAIRLEPVGLTVNFRSAPELVDWVNAAFVEVFAASARHDSEAPPFRSAAAGRESLPGAGVELHNLADASHADENAHVVAIAKRELRAKPAQSIGILVRSRRHLIGLRAALAAAGLPAHAVEIDSLTDTQLGLDLISLTQAMLHDGDRLAWLSMLRSPSVGMGWSDLLALCGEDAERGIRSALSDPALLAALSADGQSRARRVDRALEQGRKLRALTSLGQWLRSCWLLLDGPSSLTDAGDLAIAERYFRDLDRLAQAGDLDDPASLREIFARPSGAEVPAQSGIEIMTIHRAKGLEFDTVILPGLSRPTRGKEHNLFFLKEILLDNAERISLLATPSLGSPGLYDYLRSSEQQDEAAERARLLYVAATRARSRLHLVGTGNGAGGRPPRGSLLDTLWPGVDWETAAAASDDRSGTTERGSGASESGESSKLIQLPLTRLCSDERIAPLLPAVELPAASAQRPEFEWVRPASVQVGTLIHRELQRWTERAASAGRLDPPAPMPERYRRELALLGVEAQDLDAAAARVAAALELVWQDPTGRWILEPRAEAWAELRLSLLRDACIQHLQLDRSFVADNGERWVIDYKTGRHLGAAVEDFLDAEIDRYQSQLEAYARAVAAIDPRPVRVALYFPLMGRLKEWRPTMDLSR